jgi:4-hydroxybenzoate polyprenyltransferase
VRQYFILRLRTRETSFKAFLHNNWIGAAIFAGIVADFALRIPAPWIRVS